MSPRDKRLEQAGPAKDAPVKKWERKAGPHKAEPKTGKFTLPRGKIAQHRAKPGMTSPQ